MKREEDEKLWDLLGHSAEPKVSPFFARNVVRQIREAQGETSPRRWLQWLVPATGVATVIAAAMIFPTQLINRDQSDSRPEIVALGEGQDSDLLTDLEDLVGSDESSALDEGVLL